MVEMYGKERSVSMYYRDVCDRCKQNKMKTIVKNYLRNVIKRLLNLELTVSFFFFFMACLNRALCKIIDVTYS